MWHWPHSQHCSRQCVQVPFSAVLLCAVIALRLLAWCSFPPSCGHTEDMGSDALTAVKRSPPLHVLFVQPAGATILFFPTDFFPPVVEKNNKLFAKTRGAQFCSVAGRWKFPISKKLDDFHVHNGHLKSFSVQGDGAQGCSAGDQYGQIAERLVNVSAF